jgi:hypothetical protein
MSKHFRDEWPLVVPVHVLLYLAHGLQEHLGFYDRTTA